MPYAVGSRCVCVPDHTPAAPDFTNHQQCRVCGGYLHGLCGAKSGDVDGDLLQALDGLRLSPGKSPTAASMSAVEAWISVEENEEVAEAITEDITEDIYNESMLQIDVDFDDEVDEIEPGKTGQSPEVAVQRPPPYSDVAEHFCELEDVAEKCGMPDVSYHLRKAKLAWMNSHRLREAKQTCMRDFFGYV